MSTLGDYRIALGLRSVERCAPLFTKVRASSPAAKLGLAYEKRVGKELLRFLDKDGFSKIEHGSWFRFYDTLGTGHCSPDFIMWFNNKAVVVEVKHTWVAEAKAKLDDLYLPIVSCAHNGAPTLPLVIVKNMTRSAPSASLTLFDALFSETKLLHWPNIGRMLWK